MAEPDIDSTEANWLEFQIADDTAAETYDGIHEVLNTFGHLPQGIVSLNIRANITRFLPSGIADDMSDARLTRLREGRRVRLALMFVDIRGFTALSEGADNGRGLIPRPRAKTSRFTIRDTNATIST